MTCNKVSFPPHGMAMVVDSADSTGSYQPANDSFDGMAFIIRPFGNGQTIKILYRMDQLLAFLFPAFTSAFLAHGFDDVPWENLLYALTVGGEIDLMGKRFINRQTYAPHTMERLFMQRERALVSELMAIVFNSADTIAYMRDLTPYEEVATCLQFEYAIALRKTTMVYRAVEGPPGDTYRIIIEGVGKGEALRHHRFSFQPSRSWHCRRYPENV